MNLKDFDRLRKTIGMTTSASDGEALNALRAANKILADNKVTWEDVFKRLVTIDVEAGPEETPRDSRDVSSAFTDIFARGNLKGDFATFMDSLYHQWTTNHYLSDAQKDAVFKSAKRARDWKEARLRR